jgi:ABC-type multidrug transport system ATPase subunit
MVSQFSINLSEISKRYDLQWIFRNLSYEFHLGQTYAIRGYNGSGKSTLLRILSSMESPNKGQRTYALNRNILEEEKVSKYLSFTAPYMKVPDYLSLQELIHFHGEFKKMNIGATELLMDLGMERNLNKPFDKFSSGQQQKIKLALAICNSDPLLLLDEPGTNLDDSNYAWFRSKLESVKHAKLICIATNESRDLDICDQHLRLDQLS